MKKTVLMILIPAFVILAGSMAIGYFSGELTLPSKAEKAAVCFVIGGHANSQGLNMNGALIQNTVYETVKSYGFIGIVSVDGSPEVICADSYEIEDRFKSAAISTLDADARVKANNIIFSMQNITANDAEADYLESLRLAARMLSSLDGYDSKKIIVIGTGLSTAGVLDFTNNLISAEPDVIAELLNEKSEIPNFSDITVYWQQLGDVASPQQELTAAQRTNLKNIWQTIVESGGGSFACDETIANPAAASSQLPAVTPVELPSDTPISFDPAALDSANGDAFADPLVLTEEQVTFIEDKAEYLSPEEAADTLEPIAEYLSQHPSISILLAGTTAGDEDTDFSIALSLARAEAVKETLLKLGADEAKISTVGLASTKDPYHIWNAGYTGSSASANRKVIILNASSETAQSILAQSNS